MDYGRNSCSNTGQRFRARTESIMAAQLFYSMDQFFKPDQLQKYAEVRKAVWEAYFVHSEGGESVALLPPAQPKDRKDVYGLGIDELYIRAASPSVPYPSPKMLMNLFSRNKSYVCSLYEKDMHAGKINRYLGSEFQDELAGAGDSTTPAKTMLKPCLRLGL
jgi:hypothetical protein